MRYAVFSRSHCPLLDISSIGYSKSTSVTRFGPGVRSSYIIHYVISGKGYFNGKRVSAGQGFLITPGMKECYYPDKSDPWEFLWVISNDHKMATLFDLFDAEKSTNIFQYEYIYAIKEVSSFLVSNNNSTYDAFEMLEVFLKIFKHRPKTDLPHASQTNANMYTQAAEKYIRSNIHYPVTVAELTEFLGVSQPYLFKIFKERFHVSPKQYILEQKLRRAQTLLKETDMSVTHIANSVGFQDVLSFSKCFRAKVGISPQNYRKQKLP